MSDTCIVCLGDLRTGPADVPALSDTLAKSPLQDDASAAVPDTNGDSIARTNHVDSNETTNEELIAHLVPCGHDLHNECLTPWVERANSCPICRASFHIVELRGYVGGERNHRLQMLTH